MSLSLMSHSLQLFICKIRSSVTFFQSSWPSTQQTRLIVISQHGNWLTSDGHLPWWSKFVCKLSENSIVLSNSESGPTSSGMSSQRAESCNPWQNADQSIFFQLFCYWQYDGKFQPPCNETVIRYHSCSWEDRQWDRQTEGQSEYTVSAEDPFEATVVYSLIRLSIRRKRRLRRSSGVVVEMCNIDYINLLLLLIFQLYPLSVQETSPVPLFLFIPLFLILLLLFILLFRLLLLLLIF